MARWPRVAGAAVLMVALVPLTGGQAGASQTGADDHRVTLCHRTNAEENPYVVITIDRAGVVKTGHDGHDEGGVHQPGDRAGGVRWGDIIPPFSYFASPRDERAGNLGRYAGLNWTAEGRAVHANGCRSLTVTQCPAPAEKTPPGSYTVAGDSDGAVVTTGALSTDEGVSWVLRVDGSDRSVSSDAKVRVAGKASLDLVSVQGRAATIRQSGPAPAACPATQTPVVTPTPPAPGSRGLEVTKAVSPTGAASFEDVFTYTLTVQVLGNLAQSTVTVTDQIPSGTTYVASTATCGEAGTCGVAVSGGVITWSLGNLAPGGTRTVSFQTGIDTPEADEDGAIPAVTIPNTGAVRSAEVGPTPSNEVAAPIVAVEAVKKGNTDDTSGGSASSGPTTDIQGTTAPASGSLAATGGRLPAGTLIVLGGLLMLLGAALLKITARGGRT